MFKIFSGSSGALGVFRLYGFEGVGFSCGFSSWLLFSVDPSGALSPVGQLLHGLGLYLLLTVESDEIFGDDEFLPIPKI